MSNKTLMGVTLAAATLAFAFAPATFAKSKKVECYDSKDKHGKVVPMKMMSAKACEKMGGSTTKPAEGAKPAEAAPATSGTPAS